MNLFVWDFHGVLEKGNEKAVLSFSNRALGALGYVERFTAEFCDSLYGKKWYEYFSALLPGLPYEKCLELQQRAWDIQQQNPQIILQHIRPNDRAREVLAAISQSKHQQVIISRTPSEKLSFFLQAVSFHHFFPDGFALAANSHSKDNVQEKIDLLKEFIRRRPAGERSMMGESVGRSFDKIIAISDSPEDEQLTLGHGSFYHYAHPGKEFRGDQGVMIRDLREILKEVD